MISKEKTEEFLRAVPLPVETKTYTVISHGDIINHALKLLEDHGFVVEGDMYKASTDGKVALGFMKLKQNKDPEMGMTFNWSNSYNKQLRFSCGIGGFIYDNNSAFVSSNEHSAWTRKHTGTALTDTLEVMENMIESAHDHFDAIIAMKKKYQAIEVSRKQYAKIIGLLYFDKKIITIEQASTIRKEYDVPTFKYEEKGTLWALYKIIMQAVAEQTQNKWYQQQVKISNYLELMYKITTVEDESEFVAEEEVPEQLTMSMDDLPESIATTESLTKQEVVEKFGADLSEEQIEMIEREYAYPLQTEDKDSGQYGKPFDPDNANVAGDVTLEITPEEEKSEELQEVDKGLIENAQPATSFFESTEKKSAFADLKLDDTVKEKEEEKEKAMCNNCGSEDVVFNASAQMLCNNCGDEEDITEVIEEEESDELIDEDEEDELNDMFLDEDTTDEILEEESEEPVIHIESDEEYDARVAEIECEPEAIESSSKEDLLELDDEEKEVEEVIDPKIPGFINRFYDGNINQKLNIDYKEDFMTVTLESNEMFVI